MSKQNLKARKSATPRLEMVEERPTLTITLPSGWARAFLAGVEAALLGWAVPALLALLMFLKDAQNPWLRDHVLPEAGKIGTELWALTLGAEINLGGTEISFVPLTWTVVQVLVLRALMIRGRRFSAAAQWAAVPAFALTAATILLAAGQTTSWSSVFPGALLIPLVGAAWAAFDQTKDGDTLIDRYPWFRSGVRLGALWSGLAAAIGLSTVVVDTAVSWEKIMETTSLLTHEASPVGPALLVLAGYFVTFGAWALAWLSGPGFTVDEGRIHSLTAAPEATLAGIPPAPLIPTTAPGEAPILIILGLGLVLGFATALRLAANTFPDTLGRVLTALGSFAVFAFVYMSLSTGALG